MLERYRCLAVIGLYICSVLCEDHAEKAGCNITLQDVTVLEDYYRVLNISVTGEKVSSEPKTLLLLMNNLRSSPSCAIVCVFLGL